MGRGVFRFRLFGRGRLLLSSPRQRHSVGGAGGVVVDQVGSRFLTHHGRREIHDKRAIPTGGQLRVRARRQRVIGGAEIGRICADQLAEADAEGRLTDIGDGQGRAQRDAHGRCADVQRGGREQDGGTGAGEGDCLRAGGVAIGYGQQAGLGARRRGFEGDGDGAGFRRGEHHAVLAGAAGFGKGSAERQRRRAEGQRSAGAIGQRNRGGRTGDAYGRHREGHGTRAQDDVTGAGAGDSDILRAGRIVVRDQQIGLLYAGTGGRKREV